MSRRRLLRLLVPGLTFRPAIAVPAQAPPANTSDSASDPHVLTNKSIVEMAARRKNIIITKTPTPKTNFDLPTPARVELNSEWRVSKRPQGNDDAQERSASTEESQALTKERT